MTDKKNMIEESAQQIIDAVIFANCAGVNAADFGVPLSAYLFRNIRDAMFHFRAMCDNSAQGKDEQVSRHYYSLLEHLSRGEKDAVISFGNTVTDAVFSLMQMDNFAEKFSKEDIAELQQSVHVIKNTFMDLREDGMHLKEREGLSVQDGWDIIVKRTEVIIAICQQRGVNLF